MRSTVAVAGAPARIVTRAARHRKCWRGRARTQAARRSRQAAISIEPGDVSDRLGPLPDIRRSVAIKASIACKACVFTFALGFITGVQAQDQTPEHSMTGCLGKGSEPGTFRLTELGLDSGPTSVGIAETTADLEPHVGHKIEITDSTVQGKDPAAHTMKVSAMKHLAATCP